MRRLARRYQRLCEEIAEADADLGSLMAQAAPRLVALPGVGPETAGQLLTTAGDNPDRLRSGFVAREVYQHLPCPHITTERLIQAA
ncbi:hypothetical protein SALBM311S_06312 [Streptomyces alboniger]